MTDMMKLAQRSHGTRGLSRRLLSGAALAAVLACGISPAAHAEDRNWDANVTAVGSGGTGTWNLESLTWSPGTDGVSGPYDRPWDNGALDNAIFGGTAGTVTLGVPVTVGNITFNSAGYILSGNGLTLGGAASTIATTSGNATINSVIAGSSGLTKAGGGGLVLNGVNTFAGNINLNLGGLYAANDAALGDASNNIFTAAGASVTLSIGGAATSRTVTIGNGGVLNLAGSGVGSALISGNGRVSVNPSNSGASIVRLTNNSSNYTGATTFSGCNGVCLAYFSSIADLGIASSLGAPTTIVDGTIVFNQQSQYSDSVIYIGDGDSSNRNWDINGNGAIVRNQGTGTLRITGDVDISSSGSFSAETADFELLGVLSGGSFGFGASDGRSVTLGGANTFSGNASIGGLVRASVLANIGTVSSLGVGSTIALNAGTLSYTGAGSVSNRLWVVNGAGSIANDGAGALDLSGGTTFLPGGAVDSLTLGGGFAGENSYSGIISGAGNIVGNGNGTWVLSGANSFSGTVTVNAGTLRAGHALAFGATTGLVVNGGTLDLGGYDLTAPSLAGAGGSVDLGAATLTVDAATGAQSYAGSIVGTGGLRKTGAGTLTLTGTNSYNGATTIGGGKLALDFSGAGGPINDIIAASSPLILSGGTLEVKGAAGETNSQSFSGVTVGAGSNIIRATNGVGGTVNLNLGAISRNGGLVNFILPGGGAITTANADGLLGGWATINGSDYAKVTGGVIMAFDDTDYSNKDDAGTWANNDIISDSGNAANTPFFGTLGGDVQLGGLRYSANAGSTVNVGAGNLLGVDGTIIIAPSTGTSNQTITGGSLTGGANGGTLGVQHNGGGVFAIASSIVDNGVGTALSKGGAGILALSGANSYTGATTLAGGTLRFNSIANGGIASGIGASSANASNLVIEAGTLQYSGGTATTDRGFTLVDGGASRTIDVSQAGADLTFTGLVTSPDQAGFIKTGIGTLTLANAANNYVGVTEVAQGTLSVGTLADGGIASGIGAASADSANLILRNGGQLRYTGGTVAIDRGFTLGGSSGLVDVEQAGTTLTIGGNVTGAGIFGKNGDGTLVLGGANNYTGGTTVNNGTLRAGSATAFGAASSQLAANSGGTIELGGFNITAGMLAGTGTVRLGSNTLTTAGGSGVFSGQITGTGGFTRGAGSWTQTMSGCANDYTGVTRINGLLGINCIADGGLASGIGASGAGAANLVFGGGTLLYSGASAITNRGFTLTGNGVINVTDPAAALEFQGTVVGGGALFKDGAGTLILSGANSYTGPTRISGGTLRAGSAQAFGAAGPMLFSNVAGAILDLAGYNTSVSYLELGGPVGGTVNLNGATLTITTGNNSATSYFGGFISGAGNLIKNGTGTQKLTGCDSDYRGTTTINGGILAVSCLVDGGLASSMGTSSAAASNLVLNGGTLRYAGTGDSTNRQFMLGASGGNGLDASGTGAINFTASGPLTFTSPNTAQTLTLTGTNTGNNILAAGLTNNGSGLTSLVKTGVGTWILTNPNSSYTGATTISGGVLGVDKLANGGLASSIGASSAAASNLIIGNGSTLRYTGAGDTTNRLFTLSAGVTFIESSGTGAVVFTDTGAVTLQGNNLARTIALGGTNAGNNTLAGSIGNAGSGVTILAKNDSGTWVLTGNNSYSGSTNINAGTLFIGNGGTTGSVASATINNFGALGFNRSDSWAYAGAIVGTGSVRQAGSGTTLLTGTNLYTGGTTVSAGTLQLGDGGATGSLVGDVANDGIFTFNRNNAYVFAGQISGTGEVRQIGSGTTILTADHGYTGGTAISAGTLQIGNGGATGSILGDVANNGTLAFHRSNALGFDGMISGTGALRKLGAGTLTLTADNSYGGATTVEAGTLLINGDQSAATGLTTVNNGATLGGSGTIGGDVFVANGGNLNPGNSPGTLTIAGNLALSGGSILNYEFGEANVVGGPLNDLIEVGGNLVLDGTINVTVPTAGAFDAGVYRVFSYGGLLTDNGLTLGAMPAGSDVAVQTAVAGQVNLVNSTGLALSFWDGSAGPKLNGQVDGGNGSWHLGGADNNWTDAAGGINAAYADGTYAIFSGTAGTVTVDNSLGAVRALGMQFASDGYRINGDPLTLVGPQSVIRVGDGTALGADFTATIDSKLSGTSQLAKTDRGTLVLNGINSYTGGTLIDEGTLVITSNDNLGDAAGGITIKNGTLHAAAGVNSDRAVTLTGAATLSVQPGFGLVMSGVIDGAGSLTKAGGLVILTGDNSYTGGTTISAGTLQIGASTTTGSIVGDIVNNASLVFYRSNDIAYSGAISGSGQLTQVGGGTLTMTGISSYTGATNVNAGRLLLQSGGQINATSRLLVGSGGEMIIDGTGSRLVAGPLASVIGSTANSSGMLTVRNGGSASFGDIEMATGTNGTGTLNIFGAGATVNQAGSATFGRVGTAMINILGGGKLISSGPGVSLGGELPMNSQAVVTVSGSGSEWNVTGGFNARRGMVTIADGGVVTAASGVIGFDVGIGINNPSVDLLVTGAGSRFETSGTLAITNSIAGNSRGTITIGDGGVVRVGGGTLAMGPGNAVLHIGDSQMLPVGKRAGVLDAAELSFAAATNQVNFNHIDSDYVFATRMSGAGEVISSRGTTILTADNAYSGQTHINGGMIIVNGNQSAATGRINVMAGGALGGRGVIGGAVEVFGRIAPGDLGEAPGTLTINGDLFTSFNANLDYNFGQANVVGGAYNDLINVGGNLILDGTLNVTVSLGGSFDPGVYRVINYAGSLTNNGLDVDPAYYVQTSVANQVNLVNTTGLTMRFWDGVNGAKNDGVITGGDGLWQNIVGNDNWTEYDGSANAPFTDDAFAVFSGLGGTVTVDNSLGAVTASGMQFASDDYIISGADLALVAPDAIIRVGDGTAGGAAYTATIASNLTAIGNLIKSDLGTLVLTGASSVAGDFGVRGGELRLADGGTMTSANGIVGIEAGDGAIMTVAGADGSGNASTWTVGADLTVGYNGNGTLNVTDGGRVVSTTGTLGLDSDGVGNVLVSGTGSSWENSGRISVGLFGAGTLRIENGAAVTGDDGLVGGSGQGEAIVSGPGSSWTNAQQLTIGSFGAGTMRIENGASVTSNQGYIGANAAGSVTVTGAGSNWLVTDFSMTVGNVGSGSLTIDDGGRVRAEGGFSLGAAAGSSASVTLLGAPGRRGTLETSRIGAGDGTVNFTMDGGLLRATADKDNFFVGFGTRDLTLALNGGVIDTDGHNIGIAPRFAGLGGLTKTGQGTLKLTGANSYAGATLVNGGTLIVNGNQSAATGLTTVFSGATLGGTGIIGGSVEIRDGAILAPGESVGTLTINGNLSLAGGAVLDYAFGQAHVAGGALNDLVNVGGDLVLDGTINVTIPVGGSFGPGIYRVFNYGGTLTNNGLDLGTMPAGSQVAVQTAIAGQVNLVNSLGFALSFWDGATGPKNNGAVNGGDGVWRIAGGANNWTDVGGTINADYAQDSFAIFSAAAGTVTVDNSAGNVLASGMQFASDGYVIAGNTLTLTGSSAIVQVGDSSAAGAGYNATIDAVLAGSAGLVKTDSGTLILTGTNSYAGGTAVNGGTLRIARDANLGAAAGRLTLDGGTLHTMADMASNRAITIAGASAFRTDGGTTLTLGGVISGTGPLTKNGAGSLILTGDNLYAGGTIIDAGLLQLGNGGNTGESTGDVVNNGTLAFNRTNEVNFAGLISGSGAVRQIGAGTTILTANNSYGGGTTIAGGTLQLGNGGTTGSIAGDVVNNAALAFNRSNEVTFAGTISGSGAVSQTGTGTLILTGGNSYAGATNVMAGTLLINGDQSGATELTSVASGATLGGTGTIGGSVVVANGATLAAGAGGAGVLTIKGSLALGSSAKLAYDFGAANNVGSPLNDLINVGGDLVLDGTIDIAVTPGGSFGIGLYRVANYGGTLIDNGLTIGGQPSSADAFVQTSVAGQVNLINTGGAALSFWDGVAGPKFNGAVNGGDGVWQNSSGNDNWADATGAVNAGYDDGSFAIFSGTAGTVTIDNSLGAVNASGLQFAADGYLIAGQALTLSGPEAVVRVGDGTAGGASYVATIGAEIAGSAKLVKSDAGTLVLTGTNSYTGGTRVDGGTLRIASDANLGDASGGLGFNGGTLHTTASFASARQVDLTGGGSFLTDAGTTLSLTGSLGGAGALTKTGTGTLILGGTGSHAGGTTVATGTLFVNGDYAGATGTTNVASGATLGGTGIIGGNVTVGNGATLAPGAGSVGTLTIGGDLSLAGGSRLAFELGEAGAAGGALNDLVHVGGNLTLDGTIDVAVPAGGAFDVGVYRLFNYGGALIDNGLELGTLPAGANVDVQTSIGGQVNLVNSAGLTLNFWDGAAGPKNNGAVNGGNGVWQNSAGNDHWTEASGALNAAYSDGAFAVFGGTAGTVTVDNTLGAVSVAGMQFAADGYVITGDAIALGAPQTVIRVGDGSALGAGFKTTISTALGGAAELVKTDAGTLILGGANSYTGGTRISGGTVQIASDAGLGAAAGKVTLDGGTLATSANLASNREIAVAGPGTIAVAADTRFSFGGQFTGAGTFTKAGAGSLLVTGNNDGFGGATHVAAGTLAVAGSLGGAVNVASGARLEGGGRVGSLINSGVVAPGNSIGTLTVTGDYEGRGGVLEIEVELGGDTSASDRLVVGGATSGSTTVRVTNRGGLGAPTVEGIKIVDVAGASNGSFALDGDYLFDGEQAVVVGAYGYRLYKNGVATPQDGDWYLRSALLNPIDPEVPLYQPGVPVYEAYVGALQALNGLPTLQQRVGNRSWAGTPGAGGAGIWGRFESQRLRPEAAFSTSNADRKTDGWQAQMGADTTLAERSDGAALVGGINAHYGTADTAVASIFGNGSIDTKGYGVGASLTWYGPQGFYVDGQAKLSWFDSDLKSGVLGALVESNDGKGRAFSVELGKRSQIGGNMTVTPQVQMTYAHVGFDRFADPVEAAVSADKGESLKTRWGLSLDHQQSHGATGEGRQTHVYATINLAYEWLDGARVLVSDTAIENRGQRLTGELGLGGSYSWGGGRFTLYTEVAGDTALADFGAGYNLKGTAGLRMRF